MTLDTELVWVRVGLANVGEEVRGLGTRAISGHQRQDPRPRSSATWQNVRPRHPAGRLEALVCSKNHLVHPTLSAATRVTWPPASERVCDHLLWTREVYTALEACVSPCSQDSACDLLHYCA